MQAMLKAFITMNMSNSGIPSAKANSISRTFPPLSMIKIPEEEQIVEDLQEIESMQLVVQVIWLQSSNNTGGLMASAPMMPLHLLINPT